MKLILTQEVAGLGAPGDVVEVKDGYGRNYLVPRGLAIRWTRGAQKTVDSIKAARATRAVRDADHAVEIKTKLEGTPVDVKVRAGAGGRLFGAVTTAEIATALRVRLRRGRRQAHDRGRQPDQVARLPRGLGQAERRRVRQGRAQRHPGLTQAALTTRPVPLSRGGPRVVRGGERPTRGCAPR